jgi:hypothetical protein
MDESDWRQSVVVETDSQLTKVMLPLGEVVGAMRVTDSKAVLSPAKTLMSLQAIVSWASLTVRNFHSTHEDKISERGL